MQKYHVEFEHEKGFPAGKNIFYECTICNTIVTSKPEHFASCECGNIEIDATAGRVIINDKTNFKIFKRK